MNILFVLFNDDTNGGAVSIMRQIAEHYLKKGSYVHILFLKKKQYGHWDTIRDHNLHLYYSNGIGQALGNIRKLHKIYFDYSFTSVVKFTGFVGMLKRSGVFRIKTMVARESTIIFNRFHGYKLLKYRMYYRLGYKAANVLICQTEFMKEQLLKHQPWLEKYSKVLVIPNPVNIQKMNEMAKEPLDVTTYTPYIVTAGRFIPEKAYDILLDAYADVNRKHPELRLVILGDGALRPQMEEQIAKLNLRGRVILRGQVDNVYPWFKKASLCVVSSRMEGFPNVLLQMMSQNDKVVSTLCAGDIDKIEGLIICPVEDSAALANAMIECLESEKGNKRELFDNELQNRTIDRFIDKVENLN